jgi:hypothetical protein
MIGAVLTLFLNPAPQEASAPAPPTEPDISLSITARADEVRWRQVGSVSVRAWSEPSGTVVEENLTTGLPRTIPGQRTFRDVECRLRGEATIAAPAPRVEVEVGAPPETQTPEGDPE